MAGLGVWLASKASARNLFDSGTIASIAIPAVQRHVRHGMFNLHEVHESRPLLDWLPKLDRNVFCKNGISRGEFGEDPYSVAITLRRDDRRLQKLSLLKSGNSINLFIDGEPEAIKPMQGNLQQIYLDDQFSIELISMEANTGQNAHCENGQEMALVGLSGNLSVNGREQPINTCSHIQGHANLDLASSEVAVFLVFRKLSGSTDILRLEE